MGLAINAATLRCNGMDPRVVAETLGSMPLHQPKIATVVCEAAGEGCTNPYPF